MAKENEFEMSHLKVNTGNAHSLRVLIIEDSEDDALLIIRVLKKGGYDPVYERVETAAAMQQALTDQTWDIILADYKMPHFSGEQAIGLLKKEKIDIPLIIVSGAIGEETAVECMRLGAHDYFVKSNLTRLCAAITRELDEAYSRRKRKIAEQAVIASEIKFKELFENMSNCVVIYEAVAEGTDFVFKDFNRAAAITDNMDRKNIIGKSLLQEFPGVRQMGLFEVLQRVWGTGTPERQLAAYYKDKRIESWRDNFVFKLPTGELVALYNDVSERIKAERKIFESEQKYRLLVENSSEAIFIVQDEMLKFVNKVSHKLFSAPAEVLISTSFPKFIHPEDREMVFSYHLQMLRGEAIPEVYPFRIVTGDGSIKWVEIHSTLVSWQNRPATLNFLTDITERRKTAEALNNSQAQLKDAYRLANIGIWNWTADTDTVTWSEELYIIAGIEPTRLAPSYAEHSDIYAKESWDSLQKAVENSVKTGKPYQLELKLIRPDGEIRWVNAFGSVTYDNQRRFAGLQGTVQDITERKCAEQALRESEERYRNLFESSPSGLFHLDLNGRIVNVNTSFVRMLGYPDHESVRTTNFFSLFHDPIDAERLQNILKTKCVVNRIEMGLIHPRKEVIWGRMTIWQAIDSSGKIIGYDGIIDDVSEYKMISKILSSASSSFDDLV